MASPDPGSTAGGNPPLVSYLIITRQRPHDLLECLHSVAGQNWPHKQIVVVINGPDPETEAALAGFEPGCALTVLRSDWNRGVSGGRNLALSGAEGEILITLDDDALLTDPEATGAVVARFASNPELGILAFRIVHHADGSLQRAALPARDKSRDPEHEFETTWYIGAGHAIRAAVHETVGPYRDYSPWGHEELDFAFRTLEAEYRIFYFPSVEVRHKISPEGRIASSTRFETIALYHRVKVAMLLLPWRHVLSTWLVWSGIHLIVRTRFNVLVPLRATGLCLRYLPRLFRERTRLSRTTLQRIRKLKGRLWW